MDDGTNNKFRCDISDKRKMRGEDLFFKINNMKMMIMKERIKMQINRRHIKKRQVRGLTII